MNCRFVGDIGQWLSVLIMILGAVLMIYYRLDYGTVIFTIGCLVETLATKVKYYSGKLIDKIDKTIQIHDEKSSKCSDSQSLVLETEHNNGQLTMEEMYG